MNIDELVLTKEECEKARLINSKVMAELVHKAQQFANENLSVPEAYRLKLSQLTGQLSGQQVSCATVKKVFEWGDEPCTEHWKRIIPHKDCLLCQKEIKKALKEANNE